MTHDHHHHHHTEGVGRGLLWALVLNASFLVLEVVAAVWSNSLALLSDAGHMVTDVGALALAYAMNRVAARPPQGKYTYGLKRAPVLGALGNGLALLVMVVFIVREAFERLANPPEVMALPVFVVGVAGLLVNLGSALFLHGHHDDVNVRGAFLHLMGDALGSVGAMVSGAVVMLTGWRPIDALVSFGIALLIAVTALPLVWRTIQVLLEASPSAYKVEEVRRHLEEHPLVKGVEDLHVWELDAGRLAVSAFLLTDGDLPLHTLAEAADTLRSTLRQALGVEHAVLEWRCHPSPYACETSSHE